MSVRWVDQFADVALLLSAVSGQDLRDPFSVAGPIPDFVGACDHSIKGMRLAWSPTLSYAKPLSEVLDIVEHAVRYSRIWVARLI